jgi:hypothetical protein
VIFADAFTRARQRFGSVAAVALAVWAPFVVGRMILGLVLFTILERFWISQNLFLTTVAIAILFLLLAGLLSRLGLAIPILIDDPGVSVSQSLLLSITKTEKWAPFFTVFLAKTAIFGYAVYWLLNLALSWVYRFAFPHENSRFWLESIIYICLAAMLESPIFIAFSLLYRDSRTRQEEPQPAAAIG